MSKNTFRVPVSWLADYQEKRKKKTKPAKKSVERTKVINVHEKALSSLYKNPSLEKGKVEHYEQVRIFDYFYAYPDVYDLLYSVPNGGLRDAATANSMLQSGQKRGIPDISLDIPKGIYHGLRLELKVNKNKPTPEQIKKLNLLSKQGYFCIVCYGSSESITAITQYLNLANGESMPPQQHDNLWRDKC